MANVKLSQIASGGAFVHGTDNIVTVRGGNTDVLTTLNSSGFAITAVSNGSPYTAGTGQNIYTIYNTSGGAYTFNLNATPNTNDICIIVDAGLSASAHPITVQGNGNIISAGGTSGTSYEIGGNGGAVSLAYDGIQWSQYA